MPRPRSSTQVLRGFADERANGNAILASDACCAQGDVVVRPLCRGRIVRKKDGGMRNHDCDPPVPRQQSAMCLMLVVASCGSVGSVDCTSTRVGWFSCWRPGAAGFCSVHGCRCCELGPRTQALAQPREPLHPCKQDTGRHTRSTKRRCLWWASTMLSL